LTVGNFDGVHLGHQRMLVQLVALARELGTRAVAVTFDPPPLAILAPDRVPPQLTTTSLKVELIRKLGVDEVVVYPASRELLSLTAEQFFAEVLVGQLGCLGLVEGPNFRFGRGRVGDVNLLREMCSQRQMPIRIVEACESEGTMVSSSEVRIAVGQGDVARARSLLGRPYSISGTVAHGAERGRLLGFPTANLDDIETLLPPPGVYAGRTNVEGVPYPIALNIGPNPTFGENRLKVEAHLIGFTGDLYGRVLTIEFFDRLRGVVKFSSVEALRTQLQHDIADATQRASA
jgi:riboflavin kinase / FMN adenylyltransferase